MSAEQNGATGWEPFVVDGGSEDNQPRERKAKGERQRGIKGTGVDERGWQRGRFNDDFDLNKYYFGSVNEHDHSKTMHVPIDPRVHAMMAEVVNDKESAYRSMQDFVRHWVYVGLIKESEREFPAIVPELQAELARVESEMRHERMKRFKALVDRYDESMQLAFEWKDWLAFDLEVNAARVMSDQLQEPYKGMLEGVIGKWSKRERE